MGSSGAFADSATVTSGGEIGGGAKGCRVGQLGVHIGARVA